MIKVFVLLLFVRSASPGGAGFEVGTYSSMKDCQAAADQSLMKPDEEPREWRPFVGQWICVERGAALTPFRQ